MLYRVRVNLTSGHRAGDVVPGSVFAEDVLNELVRHGRIEPIDTSLLSDVPGWKLRGEKLAGCGIVTISDLLSADAEAVAACMDVQLRTIQRWKDEIARWLSGKPSR